ncbi:hypothetical protein SUGI_0221060 [Cryptomeria japonica]|uniref:probable CCR4-associated factor 1 homolog 7 n=1 Tax=Cryptomeria japonica TaxID=3369 RepID=UPI002408C86A|nr:probable CCR4-associated factor 1 homolog 7 [Cryptomeria japonica]GLJ13840.1 hypothetical protein SUGI_0221060 [Cryptomeria japonica]
MMVKVKEDSVCIREVWADNLEQEFELIRSVVDRYPYVAMDTEFPGVVIRPYGRFRSRAEYHYHTLKANVDNLKLIQLGLTFSDEEGILAECGTGEPCVWQFNLREFNPTRDIHAPDSIELLRQSGIDFKKNNYMGINSRRFAELLMSSGIVLNENIKWVTFHSAYDFGYLIKLLTCNVLPCTLEGFFGLMKLYFPSVYDVKHMIKFCDGLYGGLNRVAELLKVERIGTCHQAGSDSLLTSSVFMKLREGLPTRSIDKCKNVLYGLGLEIRY